MRLRVLGVLSVLCLVVVFLISGTILTSASRELTQELQINRATSLNRLAQVAFDAAGDGDTARLQREMDTYSGLYGEGIVVRVQEQTLASGGLDAGRPDVQNALSLARLNVSNTTLEPLEPLGSGSQLIFRPFGSASQVLGAVLLDVHADAARQKLRERWLGVGVAALALAAVLLVGAARVTGWVLRPVLRLDSALHELERTGRTGSLPEDGPPELRELSRSFTAMARTVSASMAAQRQLIADTSHQLRNPVGALRLRLDLLQLELKTAREHDAAERAVAELDRVEEILDGVLKLAAAEHRASEGYLRAAGSLEELPAPDPMDPFPVLQGEIERAAPLAEQAGCRLVLAPAPQPPALVSCHPAELAQMAAELLNNAIKYARGATITAAVRPEPGMVAVEITDDGPGLTAAERASAATRFWRSPQHASVPGTGLGMTIVGELAAANGARLVLADAVPHGLSARIEFPVHPAGHALPGSSRGGARA
ncbi:sensor histidine kinase [Pseudarthrobacter niigatensis]|uniref:Signal transduction histidine-protein kinase/phosphatase MprB n=1 Tax=Pseudarthrobacter niigatensis TaxID=369935 RepID=A0AAJ1SVK6_9MICC|nr:HAMP domain-containing sensor histidine kinase [Pseudarthrobacter niigatensis]MDQ0146633.1 signal transduction histidine kinase [Pseudarthrobacter niigatensis]MDQ0266798.1 signal transduction histidine kinase [Pseudarthrobacter niigatensis]